MNFSDLQLTTKKLANSRNNQTTMDPPPLKKLKNAGDDIEIQPLSYHDQVGLIFVINESAKDIDLSWRAIRQQLLYRNILFIRHFGYQENVKVYQEILR